MSPAPLAENRPSLAARGALQLIRAYKLVISPWLAGCCRFVPSCSDYTAAAIARHGIITGTWLGLRRLSRCHPFGGHGLDPVPSAQPPRTPHTPHQVQHT